MNSLVNLIKELEGLGFNKEQLNEVFKTAEQEIVEVVIEDFALNAEEKIVNEYTKKFAYAREDLQKLAKLIDEMIAILYGQENIGKKKEELLAEYLRGVISLTRQTKEIYQKYLQGEPEAIKMIEEAKKNPAIKSFVKQLQDNG